MADRAFFISDLHLGSAEEPNSFVLLRFLKAFQSRDQISHLFLLGDIFDLWISNHSYFINKFKPILDELVRIKKLGIEVHYFEGNHDLYLNDYFRDELKFYVHTGPEYFNIANQVVRVEHGDQMDPNDKGYIFLRWLLRTPFMKWLAPRLPSNLVLAIGERMSRISRTYTTDYKVITNDRAIEVIRQHAERVYNERPFDYLIAGHVHVLEQHQTQKYTVINLGSWFDGPKCFEFSEANKVSRPLT